MANLQPLMIAKMPSEMLLAIASHLSTPDLTSLAATCWEHYNILIPKVYYIASRTTNVELPPILWAAKAGYFRVVQGIIEIDSSLAAEGLCFHCGNGAWHRSTPLHWAAKGNSGVAKVIDFLLKKGGRIDMRDNHGATPLHWACSDAGVEAVEALLDRGANLEAMDRDGDTPVKWAARTGNESVLRLLLGRGARLNELNVRMQTILHMVFHQRGRSRSTLVQVLFESQEFNRSDMLYQTDNMGYQAFHLAAEQNDIASIELMLGAGYPVDGRTAHDETALLLAIVQGASELAALLLSRGANPNPDGEHAILSAAIEAEDLDIIERLMTRGQDYSDGDGNTPLHWAVEYGSVLVVRYLIDKQQVNVNARNRLGITPLMQVCSETMLKNQSEIADILLSVPDIEVDAQDDEGRTALLEALRKGHQALVRALISANANPDLADNEGNSPSRRWGSEIDQAMEDTKSTFLPFHSGFHPLAYSSGICYLNRLVTEVSG